MLKTIEITIGHWVTIIKAHERLLLAIILSLTLIHFGDKAYDAYGKHLSAQTAAASEKVAAIEQSNAKIEADLAALKTSIDAKAIIDDAKIAKAKQTIIIKEKELAALPLPQLAAEWQSLLVLPEGSITPQANGTIAVTTDAAHTTVSELVKVGPLTDQLVATNDKLDGCNVVRAQQEKDITGLKSESAAKDVKFDVAAKQAKHDVRHAYLKGLKHGLIIGVPVGVALTVAAIIH
jgi:hypothetical protein